MEVILGFHSTCVMNVISYEKAYCLFPRATLEERRSLVSTSCLGTSRHSEDGLAKYRRRGIAIEYHLPAHEAVPDPAAQSLYPTTSRNPNRRADFLGLATLPGAFALPRQGQGEAGRRTTPAFRFVWRWIDDSASWVLPLPQTGVTPPPRVPAHDPVAVCNWEVRYNARTAARGGMLMHFETVGCKVLRYTYLVTDAQLLAYLTKEFRARGRIKDENERLDLEERTYYDEELPALCRDFLHNLATRRLSSLRI